MSDDGARRPTTLSEHLTRYERIIIVQTLQGNGGSRRVAAEILGLSYPTLMRRMLALGITRREAPTIREIQKKVNS